jgi:hypothetical protein
MQIPSVHTLNISILSNVSHPVFLKMNWKKHNFNTKDLNDSGYFSESSTAYSKYHKIIQCTLLYLLFKNGSQYMSDGNKPAPECFQTKGNE